MDRKQMDVAAAFLGQRLEAEEVRILRAKALLRVEEAAAILRRGRSTIYRYIEEGRLTPGGPQGTVTSASVTRLLVKR